MTITTARWIPPFPSTQRLHYLSSHISLHADMTMASPPGDIDLPMKPAIMSQNVYDFALKELKLRRDYPNSTPPGMFLYQVSKEKAHLQDMLKTTPELDMAQEMPQGVMQSIDLIAENRVRARWSEQ